MTIASNADDPFDGTALEDVEITIGASSDELYGPFSADKHNDADGLTAIQFTDDGRPHGVRYPPVTDFTLGEGMKNG